MGERTMETAKQGPLVIGTIVKAFGIRGEIVARVFADTPARFTSLRSVLVGTRVDDAREVHIEHVRADGRGICLKFAGVNDRTAAGKFVGSRIFVGHRRQLKLPPGTYLAEELVGLAVLDEGGAALGRVRDVLHLPAQDVYVIEHHGREFMVPAVKEFVLKVDLEKGILYVRLIDGMVEE